ncbi:LysR family transcriptional regulator, partial [Vibrio lentus]|nr:LysR family transcriptional regulator [Vibrio lentus]
VELPMSLETFVSVDHALVSPNGSLKTGVDIKLAELGYARKVAIASSNFLTVKRLISGRKLLCIVPKLVARTDSNMENSLIAVAPPIEVPDFDIQLV